MLKGETMNAISFAEHKKVGATAKAIAAPANRSEEPSFGWVDGAIIGFFGLVTCGILGWLLLLR
jgi:hypothetical protein